MEQTHRSFKSRVLAMIVMTSMILTMLSAMAVAYAVQSTENQNQEEGIVLKKSAIPHTENGQPDGTVDVTIEAYTTGGAGSVLNSKPSDIVLVLDVSGSMDENQTTETYIYNAVDGTHFTTGYVTKYDRYGFNTGTTYYMLNEKTGKYIELTRVMYDNSGFVYYRYTGPQGEYRYVYPIMKAGDVPENKTRQYDYPVVQFYTGTSTGSVTEKKIVSMQKAVNGFINKIYEANNQVENDLHKHRISIVKYATDSYYSGSGDITDIDSVANAKLGNDFNSSGYNYTQLVHDFAVVDETANTSLHTAVNSLSASGATAVDFGIRMTRYILDQRTPEEVEARDPVVIVFSDGSPTHFYEFDPEVAHIAIEQAHSLKNDGTIVYSLSVLDGADGAVVGTDDTNKFMHYISSNFPNASSMTSPGTGDPEEGYYMTPDTEMSLSKLFDSIIQRLSKHVMPLNTDTAVVDTLSEFFDFTDLDTPTNNITIQTVTKTDENIWVVDDNIDPMIKASVTPDNREVSVDGFDFEANYVSTTPRNGNVYGKSIRYTISLTPDYEVIDALNPRRAEVNTNLLSNPAKVINPAYENPVAIVDSPTVIMNKITYIVDGVSYEAGAYDVFRLPGSGYDVIAEPTKENYTFSGWSSEDITIGEDGSFVMPQKDVTIVGSFTPNKYSVTYKYTGVVPEGANPSDPSVNNKNDAVFGTTLDVAEEPEAPAGYTFSGWVTGDVSVDDTNTFVVPGNDVVFTGAFTANGNTPYIIEHYLENVDGGYPETPFETNDGIGKTGTLVSAETHEYVGFEYDTDTTGEQYKGYIAGDGTLVLKLFYERKSYNLSYIYEGEVPEGATDLPNDGVIKFGQEVKVADSAEAEGYDFYGWTSSDVSATNGETFTMPAKDVEFAGHFTAKGDTGYKVEYYLQELDGSYPVTPNDTADFTGETGATVGTIPPYFKGFIFDEDNENNVKTGVITSDGNMTLKLYYEREKYNVTYNYVGNVPEGAENISSLGGAYMYGETVDVYEDISVPGYTFVGWETLDKVLVNETTENFVMPDSDVSLRGQFSPRHDVLYTVEHWVQNPDKTYTLKTSTEFNDGTTGEDVVGTPIDITGYKYNPDHSDAVLHGEVKGDGSLVLKLYYDRDEHSVKYEITGDIPEGVVIPETKKYIEGETVEIEDVTADGYTFSGWTVTGVTVTPDQTSFEMPDCDVVLKGSFTVIDIEEDTEYKVEHYIQKSKNNYELKTTETFTGKAGETASAVAKTISGYKFNPEHPETLTEAVILPDGSLVLMLFYDKKNIGGGSSSSTYSNTQKGYLEIKKIVSAPDGAVDSDKSYSFDIMKDSSGKQVVVQTVTLKAGETKKLALDFGTYYVYEQEADVEGYTLKVNCDAVDNKVIIKNLSSSSIAFENEYTIEDKESPDKSDLLEKDDHFAYIIGYPDGNVRPEANITRAEAATIFFRMLTDEAREKYNMNTNPFSDVNKSDWFNIAISTLTNAEILEGYNDGSFRPNDFITRAELCKMAASFYNSKSDLEDCFTDISGHWAEDFIESAYSYGFIAGYPDGTFMPDQLITRAETMKIMNRTLERIPDKNHLTEDMIKWPDNSDIDEWYYEDVQEATNSHLYEKHDEKGFWTELRPVRDWAALEITE